MKTGFRLWPATLVLALAGLVAVAPPSFAEEGSIEGKIHNGTTGSSLAVGLPVTLEKVETDGKLTTLQQTKTDAGGAFRFAGIDASSAYSYTVSARYLDVTYRTGAVMGKIASPVELSVYETTESDANITIDLAHAILQVEPADDGVWVNEVLVVSNNGDRTFVGNAREEVDGKRPTLRFSLPAGAHGNRPLEGLGSDDIVELVNGFADTRPMVPGQLKVVYGYMIAFEGNNVDFGRAIDYPTGRFSLLLANSSGKSEAIGLTQGQPAEQGSSRYETYFGENLRPGDAVMLRLSNVVASTSSSADLTVIVGAAAALAILAGVIIHIRRRHREPTIHRAQESDPVKERLITAIADLDDAFEAGEIEEEEYRAKRAARKKRLAKLKQAQAEG